MNFPDKKYRTILADPPWDYRELKFQGYATTGKKYGIDSRLYYKTLKVEEICSLPVGEASEDKAHLYLWTTHSFLGAGLKVMRAWGFDYKSTLVWVKKPRLGMGYYFRSCVEFLLFGTRGNLRTLRRDERDFFEAPIGRHSAKPEIAYVVVERNSPEPRIELFARSERNGWDSWGDGVCPERTHSNPLHATPLQIEPTRTIPSHEEGIISESYLR